MKGIIRDYETGEKFGEFFTGKYDGNIVVMVNGKYHTDFAYRSDFYSWLKDRGMFFETFHDMPQHLQDDDCGIDIP